MKKIVTIIVFILLSNFLTFTPYGLAWEEHITHKDLTESAAHQSILDPASGNYLGSIGVSNGFYERLPWTENGSEKVCDDKMHKTNCNVMDWLRYGAEKEDKTYLPYIRSRNHFHDPLKNDDEGLNSLFDGESALEWAQNSSTQSRWPEYAEGDQSWSTLRNLYGGALIETDNTARSMKFAQLFKGLGHQMHLVQDMAVPPHVRNDAHVAEAKLGRTNLGNLFFETWAKKNSKEINLLAVDAIFPTLSFDRAYAANHGGPAVCAVSQLWDADQYKNGINPSTTTAQGLAEYTNANFFSDDTILRPEGDLHYYPYPNIGNTNYITYADLLPETFYSPENQIYHVLYLRNQQSDGDQINHFLRVGYLAKPVQDYTVYQRTFYLDEACHQDYAAKLVPRAVGYSAALLNYFFRGQMKVKSLPFFNDNELTYMQLKITNTTPSRETMKQGGFVLVLRYTPEGAAADGSEDIYLTATANTLCDELAYDQEMEVYFFPATASIPMDRWDTVRCILAYNGTLGDESHANVAKAFTPAAPLFAEEWDNGLTGNHLWVSTAVDENPDNGISTIDVANGLLTMENYRFPAYFGSRTNYVKFDLRTQDNPDGLLITPETYFQHVINEMSNFPESPDACHVLFLTFNNQLSLQFSVEGPFLGLGSNDSTSGLIAFTPGYTMHGNIYHMFEGSGITVPEPLYLTEIKFLQQIFGSEQPAETDLTMAVDSIFFIEERTEE